MCGWFKFNRFSNGALTKLWNKTLISKLNSPTTHLPRNDILSPVDSVIFDTSLSCTQHISANSKPCFHSIRELKRIGNILGYWSNCCMHALLLPLSFTLKLTSITLFYSICNYACSSTNRLWLSLNSAARAVTIRSTHHISQILTLAQEHMRNSSTGFLSHINLSRLVNLFCIFAFFFYHPKSTFSHISSLNCKPIFPSFCSCSVKQSGVYVTSLHLNSDLSTFIFIKKLLTISFTLPFLLTLYSPRLSQDSYIQYCPRFVVSSHTHFTISNPHFIHTNLLYLNCYIGLEWDDLDLKL